MPSVISSHIQRLHHLAWQPGSWMQDDWWVKYDLDKWQESYRRYPACRASINQLIIKRRGFPTTALPGMLNPQQAALMMLEPRLLTLITALGLVALNCPDYLIMRSYRETLDTYLGNKACDQLLSLGTTWQTGPDDVTSETIVARALSEGMRWWQRDAHLCCVSMALSTLLPPIPVTPPFTAAGKASSWLIKISRFL